MVLLMYSIVQIVQKIVRFAIQIQIANFVPVTIICFQMIRVIIV